LDRKLKQTSSQESGNLLGTELLRTTGHRNTSRGYLDWHICA